MKLQNCPMKETEVTVNSLCIVPSALRICLCHKPLPVEVHQVHTWNSMTFVSMSDWIVEVLCVWVCLWFFGLFWFFSPCVCYISASCQWPYSSRVIQSIVKNERPWIRKKPKVISRTSSLCVNPEYLPTWKWSICLKKKQINNQINK